MRAYLAVDLKLLDSGHGCTVESRNRCAEVGRCVQSRPVCSIRVATSPRKKSLAGARIIQHRGVGSPQSFETGTRVGGGLEVSFLWWRRGRTGCVVFGRHSKQPTARHASFGRQRQHA